MEPAPELRDAFSALGVQRFVLAIHDVSFPSAPDEDIGRGSPYSNGARSFLAFVRELGFDGVQLGPQGQASPGNLSPYDGSVFSKSALSLPLRALTSAGLLASSFAETRIAKTPAGDHRAHHRHAFATMTEALLLSARRLRASAEQGDEVARARLTDVEGYAKARPWLEHDARFEAFASLHGTDDVRVWPAADRYPSPQRIAEVTTGKRDVVLAWLLGQRLLFDEHASLRTYLTSSNVRLYGDLQVGLSLRDRWMRDGLFFEGYALGAPPSRTNPDGQPWGYSVYDPNLYQQRFGQEGTDGAVAAFFRARVNKLWDEFDGVRIDHPHGLVCPWVYDACAADPLAAVAAGARLFETPTMPEGPSGQPRHARLAKLAIARPEQIDPSVPPYDDDRVRDLDAKQVDEYSALFDIVVDSVRARGGSMNDVLCEVLSTCPEPLGRVMQRHGLGRFRVTQKANLGDPDDGYRSENAAPHDWIMVGNHDTEPLRRVLERWSSQGTLGARAAYLATRLEPDASARDAFARALLERPSDLRTAMMADLFGGPAKNVLVFWADLFGERDVYNTPGVISADNWSMRVPQAFAEAYRTRVAAGEALDVRAAVAMALRARGLRPDLQRTLASEQQRRSA